MLGTSSLRSSPTSEAIPLASPSLVVFRLLLWFDWCCPAPSLTWLSCHVNDDWLRLSPCCRCGEWLCSSSVGLLRPFRRGRGGSHCPLIWLFFCCAGGFSPWLLVCRASCCFSSFFIAVWLLVVSTGLLIVSAGFDTPVGLALGPPPLPPRLAGFWWFYFRPSWVCTLVFSLLTSVRSSQYLKSALPGCLPLPQNS